MSWNLFAATMRHRRTALFWYSVGLISYSWIMVWVWPRMGDQYAGLADAFPPEFIAAFAGEALDLTTLGGYFQVEYLGLMWMAIAASAVILYAARAIAGEVGSGTMELVMSLPVSRTRFVLTKLAGLIAFVLVVVAATFVPIQVVGPSYEIDLPSRTYWLLYGASTTFLLAIGGFAFAVSAITRDAGKPAAITGGLLGGMWILHSVATIADFADAVEPVNLLRYWQPGELINEGTVDPAMWWVYGGIAAISLAVSVVAFMRRDLA